MKRTTRNGLCGAAIVAAAAAVSSMAQEITGTPGSPSATTTIDGKQLPPPPPKFGGVIKDNAAQSKPWWPPRVVPPKGAPNVLLIMTDDVGFGAPSTFGGVIPTPALDRIANSGPALYAVPFHRALLAHARGARSPDGTITRPASAWSRSSPRVSRATTASSRRTRRPSAESSGTTATAPRGLARTTTRRPSKQARSGRLTNGPSAWASSISTGLWAATPASGSRTCSARPRPIYPYVGNPGWNLTTAMADDAIDWLNQLNQIDPSKPFFCYYVPGGTHAPHHATPEWIEKIHNMHLFDKGWNALREEIFANQKRLGVIPPDAKMTPWPDDLLKQWDALTRRREEAVHPASRGLCRVPRLHRPRNRPRDSGRRRHGQARQHVDHLHQRRQRFERRGHVDRHAQRGGHVQRRRGAG